jgi:hypothetical protein
MKRIALFFSILIAFSTVEAQELYDNSQITTIEIYFPISSWDQVLDNYYVADNDERLIADSVIINGSMKDSVGVKYKGNSTFDANNSKNPINIALDYVQNNQDYQGFRTLKFSSGKNDPSFLREVLSYEIARKYMQAPQSNFAKVYINGNFHGMYSSSESINSDFQKDYLYADRDNSRFKCNPVSVFDGNGSSLEYLGNDSTDYYDFYELKSDVTWQDLIDLTNTISNNPSEIESILDIDRAIWMLAFNNVLVNLDSYTGPFRQNYYLIRDDNNRMNPIVWDFNESFGGFEMVDNGPPAPGGSNLASLDINLRQAEDSWPLLQLILNDPSYQRMYIAHIRTIIDENFANNLYAERALELQSLIASDVQSDPNAFYDYQDFLDNMTQTVNTGGGLGGGETIGITELMDERVSYLQQQPDLLATPPTIGTIVSSPAIVTPYITVDITVNVSNAESVYLGYRFRPQDVFTKIDMLDDGMHNDGVAGDGVYGAAINVEALDAQYYFYAESSDAGVFSPVRAEHEFHSLAVVGDLVINELMASNDNAVADMSSGVAEYDDWVEIYNAGPTPIDLDGYNLSDNENSLDKWQFPAVTIDPDDYLIVWLDGEDGLQDGLHSNFQLSADGEELFLSSPNQFIADAIYYTSVVTDLGYARVPNGFGSFVSQTHTFDANNGDDISIDENQIRVNVYPNPASDYLIVETDFAKNISVFDFNGKKVLSMKDVSNGIRIQTSSWSNGLYLIQTNDRVFKVIIQ